MTRRRRWTKREQPLLRNWLGGDWAEPTSATLTHEAYSDPGNTSRAGPADRYNSLCTDKQTRDGIREG